MFYDYETIKQLAKENGKTITDFLALAENNDPFYTGAPSKKKAGRWFMDLWQRFNYQDGVHLRRVHYRAITSGDIYRPDGLLYENTVKCWGYLVRAAKAARYLGMVNADSFVDRRNPEAIIFARRNEYIQEYPGWDVDENWDGDFFSRLDLPELARLPTNLPELPSISANDCEVEQDYLVEVWAEKSTMNDVLKPVCIRYKANLVTGLGELSITAVRQFLHRVASDGRPARILYISDFDPAGLGMPISLARKVEYYQRTGGFGALDICLQPIVLTADQVQAYDLPRVPIKDSNIRKANFESAYGPGQVELDALEALYPGEFANVVINAILDYYDPELDASARTARNELQSALDYQRQSLIDDCHGELTEVKSDYEKMRNDYEQVRAEFNELIKPFTQRLADCDTRLDEITARARDIYEHIKDNLENANIDPDDYPPPEPEINGDPDSMLYVSGREYLEQIEAYKDRSA